MIYQKDSSKAEEFIHHEEILDTLEYAQNNKDNRVLIVLHGPTKTIVH